MRSGGEFKSLRHCIRLSRYARHLDGFVAQIPREDILLLDFEQLRRDPDMILAQVCNFLEIDRFHTKASIHNKSTLKFRLSAKKRAELAEAVRPDVERLISEYGFAPAENWLRQPKLPRLRLPLFRR